MKICFESKPTPASHMIQITGSSPVMTANLPVTTPHSKVFADATLFVITGLDPVIFFGLGTQGSLGGRL